MKSDVSLEAKWIDEVLIIQSEGENNRCAGMNESNMT